MYLLWLFWGGFFLFCFSGGCVCVFLEFFFSFACFSFCLGFGYLAFVVLKCSFCSSPLEL